MITITYAISPCGQPPRTVSKHIALLITYNNYACKFTRLESEGIIVRKYMAMQFEEDSFMIETIPDPLNSLMKFLSDERQRKTLGRHSGIGWDSYSLWDSSRGRVYKKNK